MPSAAKSFSAASRFTPVSARITPYPGEPDLSQFQQYLDHRPPQNSFILGASNPLLPVPGWLADIAASAHESDLDVYTGLPGHHFFPGTSLRYYGMRSASGIDKLRDHALRYYETKGVKGDLIVHNSLMNGLYKDTLEKFVPKGGKILSPSPYYGAYAMIAQYLGIHFIPIQTHRDQKWKIRPSELEAALSEHSDASIFLFVNPVNPTGATYERAELEDIAKVIANFNAGRAKESGNSLLVIADEVFSHTSLKAENPDFCHFASCVGMNDCSLSLTSFSKELSPALAFAMGIGPEAVISELKKFQGGPPYPTQELAAAVFSKENQIRLAAHYAQNAKLYQHNQNYIFALMQKMNNFLVGRKEIQSRFADFLMEPKAGFQSTIIMPGARGALLPYDYALPFNPQQRFIRNSLDLCYYLKERAKIEMIPGEGFGFDGELMAMRMTMSKKTETYKAVFEALTKALKDLRLQSSNPAFYSGHEL